MKFTNKSFRKIFMLLVTLVVTLIFILALHLLLFIPIDTKALWIGGGIILLGTNIAYDLKSIVGKLITLLVTMGLMILFFNVMLHLSIGSSIYAAGVGISLTVLFYMTFAA